jgi:hypothetical protein
LAAVGKAASHAGQTQLYLTPLHAKTETIKSLIANVRAALQHVARVAEQLPSIDRWATLLRYICDRIAPSMMDVSADIIEKPVTFPPGWARLWTMF